MTASNTMSTAAAPVELLRLASGMVDDCHRDGHAARTLPSLTDAIVARALVGAQARQRALPVDVSRHGQRIVVDLVTIT